MVSMTTMGLPPVIPEALVHVAGYTVHLVFIARQVLGAYCWADDSATPLLIGGDRIILSLLMQRFQRMFCPQSLLQHGLFPFRSSTRKSDLGNTKS